MVKHHQKKKKKLSKSKKDEAARERELRLHNLDQFAGSSDEEEVVDNAKAATGRSVESDDGGDDRSGDSSDDYEQYDQSKPRGPRRRGGVGARKRSASVGNEADGEGGESSDDDDSENGIKRKKSSKASSNKSRRQEEADSSDDDDEDGDEYGDDEFGGGGNDAGRDDEMESADEFEGGDTSLSAVASKSAGMAGAMARILGAGSAPPSQKQTAPSGKSQSTTTTHASTGSVILSKTKTPLQKLQEKQKSADAALREKRRQRRATNLTAMHVPLSAATSRPLTVSHDGQQIIKSAIAQELEEERAHRRVATRGVVALFNAISKHQDQMREEASAEHRAAAKAAAAKAAAAKSVGKGAEEVKAMSKRGFLDMLKTNATKVDGDAAANTSKSAAENKTSKDSGGTSSSKSKSGGWNALRDDFMMTSKLKDWDKELSDEEDSDEDDDNGGVRGGGGGAINDDWSDDEDDKVSSASKRQRVKA